MLVLGMEILALHTHRKFVSAGWHAHIRL